MVSNTNILIKMNNSIFHYAILFPINWQYVVWNICLNISSVSGSALFDLGFQEKKSFKQKRPYEVRMHFRAQQVKWRLSNAI